LGEIKYENEICLSFIEKELGNYRKLSNGE
jgi:hypothetical protein